MLTVNSVSCQGHTDCAMCCLELKVMKHTMDEVEQQGLLSQAGVYILSVVAIALVDGWGDCLYSVTIGR